MTRKAEGLGCLGALVAGCLLASAMPADAGLGRAYSSVDVDRLTLGARAASTSAIGYTAHVLTLPNTGTVKEFTRTDGKVFAVAWRGPGRPDLRLLLGDSFDTVQADNGVRIGRRARRPIGVNRSNLIVQSGGHPGAYWGVAVIPQLAPAGFSASDLN